MIIDIAGYIGAVRREVSTHERDGKRARTVTASRSYDTTPEDLWDALSNPERIPRWFLPVSGDLRPGGRYQLEGNAGGAITGCEPPRRLAVTWEFGGNTSWVEVRLTPEGEGRTRLELAHEMYEDEHWAQYGAGATGIGWEMALLGLGEHLASEEAVDPQDAMAWMGSPEGHEFIQRSGDGWSAAAVADGATEAEARAAAARTHAFYTGAPEPAAEG